MEILKSDPLFLLFIEGGINYQERDEGYSFSNFAALYHLIYQRCQICLCFSLTVFFKPSLNHSQLSPQKSWPLI